MSEENYRKPSLDPFLFDKIQAWVDNEKKHGHYQYKSAAGVINRLMSSFLANITDDPQVQKIERAFSLEDLQYRQSN